MVEQTAVTYRPATKEDQKAIKSLIRAVQINPIGLKWQQFIVAVGEDGRLIGCGQIKPHWGGSRELASIAVQKEWRRQGIAANIIQQLLADAPSPVWLTCMNKLVPFYEQFGFLEVTDGRIMPLYFRLAHSFFSLFQRFTRLPGYLAIMVYR